MVKTFFCLSICASAGVDDELLVATPPRLQRVTIVVNTGSSTTDLNQKALDELAPLLRSRLPVIFALNGISVDPAGTPNVKSMALTIQPNKASVSGSRSYIDFRTSLYSPELQKQIWKGSLDIGYSHRFRECDDKTADGMALKLLKQLRQDELISRGVSLRAPQ